MKINFLNNLPFEKSLAAKAYVQKDNKPSKVNIYKLDNPDDIEDLKAVKKQDIWKYNWFVKYIMQDFLAKNSEYECYAMEDENERIICLGTISTKDEKANHLDLLETAPKLSCYDRSSENFRYIGETMLAFFAGKSQKQNKKLVIDTILEKEKTLNFYFNQCKFKPHGSLGAEIEKSQINKFLKENQRHTQSGKIKLFV